ncbi:MAG: shikimate dehydrogenase [Candidatus Marinimicrobia bacterium]|nr:shikimate dehydrogenase [Candidatus Neomarinimicrobiota bacterium]|tara:strand:+ start:1199 stop:2065 length:867 start_codon:yes stop_codon:yes gene_type:complete
MEINKNRFKFAVIGDPLDQSLSPILHEEVFFQLGINGYYKKQLISAENLNNYLNSRILTSLNGFNVTLPHKNTIMRELDVINTRALDIGAVNCVLNKNNELWGFNTDWFGFAMALHKNKIKIKGKVALILGAGGVSSAVIFALVQNNISKIIIKNRTKSKIKLIIKQFSSKYKNIEIIEFDEKTEKSKSFDLIINCTSLGMSSYLNLSPLCLEYIKSNHIIIDTIYNPSETQLLKDAKKNGAKTLNGLDMFIYQGLASLDIWFEKNITEKIDYEKLKMKLMNSLCLQN